MDDKVKQLLLFIGEHTNDQLISKGSGLIQQWHLDVDSLVTKIADLWSLSDDEIRALAEELPCAETGS